MTINIEKCTWLISINMLNIYLTFPVSMYNFFQCVIKMIKYIVIEMWSNWCFYMLQLKVEVYTTFTKGYLAIFFF